MGCGCSLMTPYEKCALLLKDYNNLVLQRKLLIDNKAIIEKKKTDKMEHSYRIRIYKNLVSLNEMPLTNLEGHKLKQLNDLFLVLLSEESNMNKRCDSINDNEGNKLNNNDVLIIHQNIIKGRKLN